MASLVTPTPSTVTPTEYSRFLKATKGNAEDADQRIQEYLEWRETYLLDAHTIAEQVGEPAHRWFGFLQDKQGNIVRSKKNKQSRIVYASGAYHLCGSRCLNDSEIPVETTLACMTNLIDQSLPRDSKEKITIFVDVRPNWTDENCDVGQKGWPNPTPSNLTPLIRQLSKIFGAMYPERLEVCVVYPMPWIIMAAWYVIKLFMDPVTANKVVFLSGSSYENEPLPEGLAEYGDTSLFNKECYWGGRGGIVPPPSEAVLEEEEEEEEEEEIDENGSSDEEENALVF